MAKKKSKTASKPQPAANGTPAPAATSPNAEATTSAHPPPATPSDAELNLAPLPPPTNLVTQPEPSPEDDVARADRLKKEGNDAFKAAKYSDAINSYTKAIELCPKEPSYLTNRAASYMGLNRYKIALEDCQRAATLQAHSPSAKTLSRLARCQIALGDAQAALSTIEAALRAEPASVPALVRQKAARDQLALIAAFQKARDNGDWAFARIDLEKAVSQCEGDIPLQWRCWRVELDVARRQWDAAVAGAGDALRLDQSAPDTLALRARVLLLTNKLPQALQHCQSALRFDPDHRTARLLLKRVRDIERVKEEGNAAFKAGRQADAVEKYTEALDLVGDAPADGGGGLIRATLLSNRGVAYQKLGHHARAVEDCDASLVLQPSMWKALRTRARARIALDELDAAVADLKAAVEQGRAEGAASDDVERSLRDELRKAEVLLKRSKEKDYYKILGLTDRTCGDAEIKKAYRRESLRHHPDKGGDEEKFKLASEAYSVLSNPERRQRYDDGEDEDGQSGGPGGFGGAQFDLSELFAQMHGMNSFRSARGGAQFGHGGGGHHHGGGHHFHFG